MWSLYSLSEPSPDYDLIPSMVATYQASYVSSTAPDYRRPRIPLVIVFMHDIISAYKSDHNFNLDLSHTLSWFGSRP